MDRHTLLDRFRSITSLASLAYTFTILHTIQYSMRDHDNNNNTTAQTPQDNDSTNQSTSMYDSPATTSMSETIEKSSASGRWTDDEVKLLLEFVEANCTLTTARGLNLKKSEFSKARTMVKSKDSTQCHYKWGRVRNTIFIIDKGRFHSLILHYSYVLYTKQFRNGTRSREVVGTKTMGPMHERQVKKRCLRSS